MLSDAENYGFYDVVVSNVRFSRFSMLSSVSTEMWHNWLRLFSLEDVVFQFPFILRTYLKKMKKYIYFLSGDIFAHLYLYYTLTAYLLKTCTYIFSWMRHHLLTILKSFFDKKRYGVDVYYSEILLVITGVVMTIWLHSRGYQSFNYVICMAKI